VVYDPKLHADLYEVVGGQDMVEMMQMGNEVGVGFERLYGGE
jgi:hypothetical protein